MGSLDPPMDTLWLLLLLKNDEEIETEIDDEKVMKLMKSICALVGLIGFHAICHNFRLKSKEMPLGLEGVRLATRTQFV